MTPQAVQFTNVSLSAGQTIGPSVPWPAGATYCEAGATLSPADVSDPSLTMNGMLEISIDNESSWSEAGGGWQGGGIDTKNGGVPSQPFVRVAPGQTPTHVRWHFKAVSRPVTASGSFTFSG